MTRMLTEEQVARFHREGYLSPLRVMSEEAAQAVREKLEAHERQPAGRCAANCATSRTCCSSSSPTWCTRRRSSTRSRTSTAPTCSAGPPTSSSRKPARPAFVSWHQDSTYWGLSSPDVVTAWVALTESNQANGAMEVIPGTHLMDQVPHRDTFDNNNLLSRGQEVAVEVDASKAVRLDLRPGEMSLHHVRLVHGSPPNPSDDRRIGFAIRYIPTSVRQIHGEDAATLVRGVGRVQHLRARAGAGVGPAARHGPPAQGADRAQRARSSTAARRSSPTAIRRPAAHSAEVDPKENLDASGRSKRPAPARTCHIAQQGLTLVRKDRSPAQRNRDIGDRPMTALAQLVAAATLVAAIALGSSPDASRSGGTEERPAEDDRLHPAQSVGDQFVPDRGRHRRGLLPRRRPRGPDRDRRWFGAGPAGTGRGPGPDRTTRAGARAQRPRPRRRVVFLYNALPRSSFGITVKRNDPYQSADRAEGQSDRRREPAMVPRSVSPGQSSTMPGCRKARTTPSSRWATEARPRPDFSAGTSRPMSRPPATPRSSMPRRAGTGHHAGQVPVVLRQRLRGDGGLHREEPGRHRGLRPGIGTRHPVHGTRQP